MLRWRAGRLSRVSNVVRRGVASIAELKNNTIFISTSVSPYFNLSIEDWLLKNAIAEEPVLFMYRNKPSVIIGRNQNPWKETNLATLRAEGIELVRRRSGGGTVYHDLGNTNFSIHTPRASFARARTAGIVARALRDRLGVHDAAPNERNDVCVGERKVSGSAYKIAGSRAYHHGTMLITSRLNALGVALRNDRVGLVTKGVESVRSPVGVLREWVPTVSHDAFVDAVVASFSEEYNISQNPVYIDESDFGGVEQVGKSIDELQASAVRSFLSTYHSSSRQSWDWIYGQTPEFTHVLEQDFPWGPVTIEIHSKHGIILDATSEATAAFAQLLVGQRYGTLDDLVGASLSGQEKEMLNWLLRVM